MFFFFEGGGRRRRGEAGLFFISTFQLLSELCFSLGCLHSLKSASS